MTSSSTYAGVIKFFLRFPEATFEQYLEKVRPGKTSATFRSIIAMQQLGLLTYEFKDGAYYVHIIKEALTGKYRKIALQAELDKEAGIMRDLEGNAK